MLSNVGRMIWMIVPIKPQFSGQGIAYESLILIKGDTPHRMVQRHTSIRYIGIFSINSDFTGRAIPSLNTVTIRENMRSL